MREDCMQPGPLLPPQQDLGHQHHRHGHQLLPHGRLPWRNHPAAQHELPSVDERYEVGGRELRLPATVARPPRALVELQPVPNVTIDYVFHSDSVLTIGKTMRSSGRRAPRARCTTAL
ncbi:hypothetical protein B296_00021356 [Ensete ventricosum]|uniref:Uncharacterized protein n=1 Tax=Ensete ventricosum TaxID=4639 RepID=A0A426ZR53_ENSVE|nr:hypothetical protein B296_00021356 [Ensete ventricosum]